MIVVQDLVERLRPLVGFKGWDYCVLWKLSDNQRYIEWMGCCCAGAHQNAQLISRGEELHHEFPHHHVSQVVLPCRDVMFQHPTTKSCELLSLLPSSIPLDSGIHAQALISNVPRWLNFSNSSDSIVLIGETIGTRALIPVAGGLVELLVTKHVAEDQNVIEFVTSQCNFIVDREAMMNATSNMDTSISISSSNVMMGDEEHNRSIQFLGSENGRKDQFNHFHTPITPEAALENPILPYDVSVDRIRLCNSPMNFLQQFNYEEEYKAQSDEFFEGADHQNGLSQMESLANREEQGGTDNDNKEFLREKNGRTDSISDCSDQIDDDDEDYGKCQRRKVGKGQAKNLEAERKRRKKLNERLYTLRTLVPNITKLDKASILGDAISFVKELQRQAKELQDELEEPSNDEGVTEGNHSINVTQDVSSMNQISGANQFGPGSAFGYLQGATSNGTANLSKPNNLASEVVQDKGQQMEPQVEVAQIDGNKFFVKVFCEFKAGGFVRLMEAFNSLGFVVTNANVTRVLSLVSNVFQVEMKDSELVQADYVRDSLLELTRNPPRGWPDQVANASESCSNADYRHHHHHHQHFTDGHTNSNYQPHHHNR